MTLARALLADADLLLLDEPTNHLDIDSVEWLEQFLVDYGRAFVLVTHDRRLLERVGRRVLSVEHEHVEAIAGDFATYVRERAAGGDLLRRRYEQDLEKIEQLQRFYDRFHAKKNKAKQAKAKLTQIERIKAGMKAPPREARGLRLGLPQPTPSARVVLEMKAPAVGVGSADEPAGARTLITDVDLVLERGEKIALVGANGAGKTTLVETVAGLRSVAAGAVHLGHNVRPAYYSQQGRELREEWTMLENVLPLVGHDEQQARGLLGRFLFTADEVEKKVEVLSGGERSRLRLLRLLVGEANFLLLDEPTNHLDVDLRRRPRRRPRRLQRHAAARDPRPPPHRPCRRDASSRSTTAASSTTCRRRGTGRRGRRAPRAARPPRPRRAPQRRAPATHRDAPAEGAAPAGAAKSRQHGAEEARRRRARLRAAEAAVLKLERRLGEIDAELAEPETYADRDALNLLLDERTRVEDELRARVRGRGRRLVDEVE